MIRVLAIALCLLGLAGELLILREILYHPAGGWPETSWLNWAANGGTSSLPYAAAIIWSIFFAKERVVAILALRTSALVSVIGVFFAFVALRQYGHATPFLLIIGFAGQWVSIAVGLFQATRGSRTNRGGLQP